MFFIHKNDGAWKRMLYGLAVAIDFFDEGRTGAVTLLTSSICILALAFGPQITAESEG